ncbi:transposase [Streptomyces sp. NBC_01136]|uniref:transposase n=1 Tax=Streptomyces sp. NBC_01136 TaxID=2903754 RepID=UPI0038668162
MSLPCVDVLQDALGQLSCFRADFYDCLTGRADALFELTDALLCTDGPVKTLVGLALAPEHRRGHGALYGGLNHGRIEIARLRRVLASVALPRAADGRLVLAVDVSPWLRPDAATSDARSFCHTQVVQMQGVARYGPAQQHRDDLDELLRPILVRDGSPCATGRTRPATPVRAPQRYPPRPGAGLAPAQLAVPHS